MDVLVYEFVLIEVSGPGSERSLLQTSITISGGSRSSVSGEFYLAM